MRSSVLVVTAVIVAACGRDARQAYTPTTDSAGGATSRIAVRREPQPYLDTARSIVAFTRPAEAARPLRLAAALLYEHAGLPTSTARVELRSSAAELDSLAARLEADDTTAARALEPALIRVNLAEADHHRSQAAAAWARNDSVATGEELVMSVDHLERALRDSRGGIAPETRKLMTESFEIGAAVAKGRATWAGWDVTGKLGALGLVIRTEMGRP